MKQKYIIIQAAVWCVYGLVNIAIIIQETMEYYILYYYIICVNK